MPNSIEIEQAVLGALLLSREKYPEVDALISSVDFESDVHREIYDCIKELADQDKACLLYTSPSPRDDCPSRMPSSA